MIIPNEYQKASHETAQYPEFLTVNGQKCLNIFYPALGLVGEAGEVANKVKKVLRDQSGIVSAEAREAIAAELGDVMWYVAEMCTCLGLSLEQVMQANQMKLADRAARGKISGDGDHR